MPRSPTETIRFLTLEELARLFAAARANPRDRALFLLAYRHGLRASEIGLLRTDDIDFRTLRIMQVELRQLKQWYHTLDQLLECKEAIEQGLYLRSRDLFSLRPDIVFYDLTSTYFEGKGPPEIGAYGHSRDGKPRNPQVLVGLVLVDGWPIAHHVFEGNLRDAMTVSDVVQDLERRFGIKRMVLVGDRGMVTSANLEQLRSGGHGYIVGRNRRRRDLRLHPIRNRQLDRMPSRHCRQ
jgi:transposase